MPQTIWATVMLGGPRGGGHNKGNGSEEAMPPSGGPKKSSFLHFAQSGPGPHPQTPPQLSQTRHQQAQPEAHGPAHLLSDPQLQQ